MITKYTGPWGKKQLNHLLRRCLFGVSIADMTYFSGKTMDEVVDLLTTMSNTYPPLPLKDYTDEETPPGDPDLSIALGETWMTVRTNTSAVNSRRRDSLRRWWAGVILNQDRTIREKMVLFWNNHFGTGATFVNSGRAMYKHIHLFRQHPFGDFKFLCTEITKDPAMLYMLNGWLSTKYAPDENYARELQELFTLGKENVPNYTESDIKAAARLLTGWKQDAGNNTSYFDVNDHDVQNKQFSSFYNNRIITGRTGPEAGDLELNELIDMIFDKQLEVSRFIVEKIYRWFVTYNISAEVRTEVIDPLRQLLIVNNWDIKPVIVALLTSDHFYTDNVVGAMIKSPVDLVFGLFKEFNLVFPTTGDVTIVYEFWSKGQRFARDQGQNLADPPDIAGWQPYYQTPTYYHLWINSDTYSKRNAFGKEAIQAGFSKDGIQISTNVIGLAKTFSAPSNPNILIDDAISLLFTLPLDASSKQQIKSDILLLGQSNDNYWSNAWNSHIANPNNTGTKNFVEGRLFELFTYLTTLPEYQLM